MRSFFRRFQSVERETNTVPIPVPATGLGPEVLAPTREDAGASAGARANKSVPTKREVTASASVSANADPRRKNVTATRAAEDGGDTEEELDPPVPQVLLAQLQP